MQILFGIIQTIIVIGLFMMIYRLKEEVDQLKQYKVEDLDQLLETYLEEIRYENEMFKETLQEISSSKQGNEIERNEQTKSRKKDKIFDKHEQNIDEQPIQQSPTYLETMVEKEEDEVETSIEAKVLQYYEQGMSIDSIAKKLNRGKTEIELMIQFFQQKNI